MKNRGLLLIFIILFFIIFINNSTSQNFNILATTPPAVTLISPLDRSSDSDGAITFQCSAVDDNEVKNISLYTNFNGSWSLNKTLCNGEYCYSPDMVLWMHFNNESAYENDTHVYDFSGNKNNGTVINAKVNNTNCKYKSCFEFNSENNYIHIPNSFSLSNPVRNITILAWVNVNNLAITDLSLQDHTCILLNNSKIMCWGRNSEAEVGDNSTTHRSISVFINHSYNFTSISTGFYHTCGIISNGSALCWGNNSYGQLGDNTRGIQTIPTFVNHSYNFTRIAAGLYHTCGILINGSAVCWGYNDFGQIGDSTQTVRVHPTGVKGNYNYTYISTGFFHTCGVLINGSALCWGRNTFGALGDNSTSDRTSPVGVKRNYNYSTVLAGGWHSCGHLVNGSAVCWGRNNYGQIGDNSTLTRTIPTTIQGNYNYTFFTVGFSHNCGILINGSTVCWGENIYGQIGVDSLLSKTIPTPVLGNYNFSRIIAGYEHTCGVLSNNKFLCWGRNSYGQLGKGVSDFRTVPVDIGRYDYNFSSLHVGATHVFGILKNGTTLRWGDNSYGQLGDGDFNDLLFPNTMSNYNFVNFSAGEQITCGLFANRTGMCWGFNDKGQLGINSTTNKAIPTSVYGGYQFKTIQISLGGYHTCGILVNGSALCWGKNNYGQLGDNTTSTRTIPTTIKGNYNFSAISLGTGYSCGLLINGTLMCWGQNHDGQLGDGTTTSKTIPTTLKKIGYQNYNFSYIAAGGSHICGILINGSLTCWGRGDDYGQLGNGALADKSVPTPVSGEYNYTFVSAGYYHTCGILINGSAVCWGHNVYGGLGDNSTIRRLSPVGILGNYNFSKLSINVYYTCGVLVSGSALCWGQNSYGQFGIGVVSISKIPTNTVAGLILSKSTKSYALATTFDNGILSFMDEDTLFSSLSSGWHQVGFTFDRTTEKLYIDGSLVNSKTNSRNIDHFSDNLEIGKNTKGFIDEIAVYNKTFTADEILDTYQAAYSTTNFNSTFNFGNIQEGTYSWNCLAYDNDTQGSFAVDNWTVTVSFPKGGVSRGPPVPIYQILEPSKAQLEEEYKVALYKNWKITFWFENILHTVYLNNIFGKTAEFTLTSTTQIFTLTKNETKKFDLNNDTHPDLVLKLIDTDVNNVFLSLQLIYEEIPGMDKKIETQEEIKKIETEKESRWGDFIFMSIIILLIILLLYFYNKKDYK